MKKLTKYTTIMVSGLDVFGAQTLANNFAGTTIEGNLAHCELTCKEEHANTIAGTLKDWGVTIERMTKGAAK